MSGGITVSVIGDAAIGAMTEDLIPYLAPSIASVLVKVTRPILAALKGCYISSKLLSTSELIVQYL